MGSNVDMYLMLDGIKGESTAKGHEGWIEVLSYNHQMIQPTSQTKSSAGGGTTHRTQHGDFQFTKFVDSASPKLYEAVSNGKHIAKGKLDCCRAGGSAVVFLSIDFQQIVVSKVAMTSVVDPNATGDAQDMLPGEAVDLNYGIINWEYTAQKRADGSGGGKVSAKADLTTGTT